MSTYFKVYYDNKQKVPRNPAKAETTYDCMCNELRSHVGGSLAGHVRCQGTRDKSDPSD